jgi:hypothetical protein
MLRCLFGYAQQCGKSRRPLGVTNGSASGSEHLFDPFAHFLMREEFTVIELVQAFPDFLPKPRVVVRVTLSKRFDVFVRAAPILGSHSG